MAKKKEWPTLKEGAFPRKAVPLKLKRGDSEEIAAGKFAKLVTSSELAAYRVINASETKSGIGEQIDVPTLIDQLREQAVAINHGEMAHAEAMLMNQATALQSLFARLTERGMGCDGIQAFEANMRMALRAQSQCRATLETLAAIKNPPIVYARQANVTTGPQQINNGTAATSRARENENQQNELSGNSYELCQDTKAPGLACRVDPALEAVGEVYRPLYA